jgi:1-acyl-sn-glycerol-3-phosphate acyltransferase
MSAGEDRVYRGAMRLGAALFRVLDLRRDVAGERNLPASGGAVLAITHFGYLDFALVQQVVWRRTRRLTRFLVTDAAFAHRLAGPLLRAMGHIPVNRRAGAGAYRLAAKALRRGELVGIFPESAVSLGNELLPFKPGAAALGAETGLPVIPVLVWGGQQVLTKRLPLRWRRARHARIHLEFGPALHFAPGTDPSAGTALLRDAMSAMVARLAAAAPDRSAERLMLEAQAQ